MSVKIISIIKTRKKMRGKSTTVEGNRTKRIKRRQDHSRKLHTTEHLKNFVAFLKTMIKTRETGTSRGKKTHTKNLPHQAKITPKPGTDPVKLKTSD